MADPQHGNNDDDNSSNNNTTINTTIFPSPPAPPPAPPQQEFKSQRDEELIRLALHQSPFFSCLDHEQLDRFVAAATLRTFAPNHVVIYEGRIDGNNDDEDQDHDEDHDDADAHVHDKETAGVVEQLIEEERAVAAAAKADDNEELRTDDEFSSAALASKTSRGEKQSSDVSPMTDGDENDVGLSNQVPVAAAVESDSSSSMDMFLVVTDAHRRVVDGGGGGDDGEVAAVVGGDDHPNGASIPIKSGLPRLLYIIRSGRADVWLRGHHPTTPAAFSSSPFLPPQQSFRPATLGPGSLFGEGGFLFGRQHSASVVVNDDGPPLECWVVDFATFRDNILPSDRTTQLFRAHARNVDAERNGEPYMTVEDFVQAVTNGDVMGGGGSVTTMGGLTTTLSQESSLLNLHIANTYSVLYAPARPATVTTTSTTTTTIQPTAQRLYLNDFCFFHFIVARPDPEVDLAFLLMDERQTGRITIDDLTRFLGPVFPDLDFNQAFFQRYFGPHGDKSIRQSHFSQFLVDLQREIGKQTFLSALAKRDCDYLDPIDFVKILKSTAWRIPAGVMARLESLYNVHDDGGDERDYSSGGGGDDSNNGREKGPFFTYGDFLAFQEVLGNLPFVCNMVNRVQDVKGTKEVSPDDFKVANQVFGLGDRFSRRQVDIVFQLFDLDKDGFISHDDTVQVCGLDFVRRLVLRDDGKLAIAATTRDNPCGDQLIDNALELQSDKHDDARWTQRLAASILDFSQAAFFGGFAVGLLYPIDIVKTRIMNQRHGPKNTILYQGPLDCLRQIIRNEGRAGLYRGIVPSLLSVAPERAIKLQVHHLVKDAVCSISDHDPTQTSLWIEAFSGGCAGASQILVTNPMEIAKIRLQMQGETRRVLLSKGITPLSSPGFGGVLRGLGFPGVYRGASACLLRDIPFSAIYFTSYAALKSNFSTSNGSEQYHGLDTLLAGTVAAIPAALLTNPADVVKTRLQTIARPGETTYHGIDDCFRKILDEEGPVAFTRGVLTRVLRVAPQFGITMLAFEMVTKLLNFSSHDTACPPTDIPVASTK